MDLSSLDGEVDMVVGEDRAKLFDKTAQFDGVEFAHGYPWAMVSKPHSLRKGEKRRKCNGRNVALHWRLHRVTFGSREGKDMPLATTKTLILPNWVEPFINEWSAPLATEEDRMRLAISLSAENVRRNTGGPFAAVIFEADSHRVVSAGVNVVVPQGTSLAHGEVVALLLAQQALSTHDLGRRDLPAFEMATTSQPCIQCYGALIWSGITRVLVGARGTDVEALAGFDEGPVPPDWIGQWARRGIEARIDVLRQDACAVLKAYKESGAPIYNSEANQRT
jgi:tRNA(Arg) A34 adenosine deaminase TadA